MKVLEKIDQGQLTLLLLYTIPATIQLTLPRVLTKIAQEASWLSAGLGSVLGFLVLAIATLVALRLPPGPLPVALEALLGKFWGKAVCLVFAVGLFAYVPWLLRIFGSATVVGMMPYTPLSVLLLVFSLNVFLLASFGLEAIARSAQAFFFPLLIIFLTVVVGSLPLLSLQRLKPLLGAGFWPIFRGAEAVTHYFGEGVIVLALVPALQGKKGTWKSVIVASALVGLIFTSVTLMAVGSFGAVWTASVPFPVLMLARNVAFGRFIHRFEPFFMAVWYLSVYVKTSLLVFLTAKLLAAVFDKDNAKLIVGILLSLSFPLALIPEDMLTVFQYVLAFGKYLGLFLGFGLPLVLLPFTFKKRGERK
jgi:spore germination protein KB